MAALQIDQLAGLLTLRRGRALSIEGLETALAE